MVMWTVCKCRKALQVGNFSLPLKKIQAPFNSASDFIWNGICLLLEYTYSDVEFT